MSPGLPFPLPPSPTFNGDGSPGHGHSRTLARGWAAFAVLSAVAVLIVFAKWVPLQMDEFVSYQTLAALSHPHSVENVFCYPNASFYLRVLGRFNLPLLTYDYIGSLSSLLYSPFFFLWPSPLSARLTGLVALLIQAWVLGKMFRFNVAAVFCCLLFFIPYSFAHIADTGPVAFQTTSVLVVCYLLRQWILSRHPSHRLGMMAAAGWMIGLGCWVKPTYFFVGVGLALTAIAGFLLVLRHRGGERLRRSGEYLILLVCAAGSTLLVYEAQRANGAAYLPVLNRRFIPGQIVLQDLGTRFRENVLHFLVNPLDGTSSHFDVRPELPVWLTAACLLLAIAMILAGGLFPRMHPRHRGEILFNYGLFGLALLLVATNIYAKSMHHAVLAYPFVLLAIARALQLQRRHYLSKVLLALFLVLNGSLLFRFPSLMEEARASSSPKAYAGRLNEKLNRGYAPNSVIACVDWGIYFIQTVYGPGSQVVLDLCAPDNAGELTQAATIARRLHRDLAVVGLRDNDRVRQALRARCPDMDERPEPGRDNPWVIWQIPYEKLDTLAAISVPLNPTSPTK
jgi:hypothetical protein